MKTKTKILALLTILLSVQFLNAQDQIFKKTNEVIQCKVKEIPSKKDPSKIVPIIRGGVNVNSVKDIANAILPIPGGLISMVIALLFRNALMAFQNSLMEKSLSIES